MDTICALSSGMLPSGVAVVRISGPLAADCLTGLCAELPEPRAAKLSVLVDPSSALHLDQALVLWFPSPRSFTGEDCAELHLHGGRAVVSAVLACLQTHFGCRMAEAGEFTKRALINGKLDLVEVEGVADLIASQTEAQRRQAIARTDGRISEQFMEWRENLLRTRALIEAEIDFADEDDVPDDVSSSVWAPIVSLKASLVEELDNAWRGERIRDGFRVAIVGAPNVGKSSLINALAEREVAIVTDIAGTTRDALSVDLDINGYPVTLFDTAGQRETEDVVERIGVDRAREIEASADLVLSLSVICDEFSLKSTELVHVGTKLDDFSGEQIDSIHNRYDVAISSKTGEGLDDLRKLIASKLGLLNSNFDVGLISQARHRSAIEKTASHIDAALRADLSLELRSEELRLASMEIGRIVGLVDVEELLDVIFRDFCIGK